jgi:hypothetical protein
MAKFKVVLERIDTQPERTQFPGALAGRAH